MRHIRYRITLCLAAILLLATTGPSQVSAQDSFVDSDEISNGALVYWQAFSFLPKLDEKQQTALNSFTNGDNAEAEVAKIVDSANNCFEFVDLITPQTNCNWQIPKSGLATLLPHLSKARVLAKLLVVEGCKQKAVGNNQAASQRFAQAILLARNVDDGPLVCLLVGNAIEQSVIDALSDKMDAEFAKAMQKQLESLPQRASLQGAFQFEKDLTMDWLTAVIVDRPDNAREELKIIYPNPKMIDMIFSGSKEERQQDCDELRTFYDELGEIAANSESQEGESLDAWNQKVNQSRNLLATGLLPSTMVFGRQREASAAWNQFMKELQTKGN